MILLNEKYLHTCIINQRYPFEENNISYIRPGNNAKHDIPVSNNVDNIKTNIEQKNPITCTRGLK